jgi:hypothetical protein
MFERCSIHVEMKNVKKIFVEKPERKRAFRLLGYR